MSIGCGVSFVQPILPNGPPKAPCAPRYDISLARCHCAASSLRRSGRYSSVKLSVPPMGVPSTNAYVVSKPKGLLSWRSLREDF
jgi:hypothetical protein